ncbi:MAG TPA: protease pro-enzyme activation domain-containing protein [Candidatus Binataceae bacterium]|nr:protease pro-enzyme activation domain-containing protein [Candidatus Binataceae bacterium]
MIPSRAEAPNSRPALRTWFLFAFALALLAFAPLGTTANAAAPSGGDAMIKIPGHVLPALAKASVKQRQSTGHSKLTVTFTLKRDDQAGFARYLHDIYDRNSNVFHHFLTQRQIADRFGPSRGDYESALAYLKANGFKLVRGSKNRLTITARGTRAMAERAFDVHIADYRIGDRNFYANAADPALPSNLAPHVQAIAGLSNYAIPYRSHADIEAPISMDGSSPDWELTTEICFPFTPTTTPAFVGILEAGYLAVRVDAAPLFATACLGLLAASGASYATCAAMAQSNPSIWQNVPQCNDFFNAGFATDSTPAGGVAAKNSSTASVDTNLGKNPQKIGLLEFDTFNPSDVDDWLKMIGGDANFGQLSVVPVNGGVAAPGPAEPEVLLDVDTVMLLAPTPATKYVVYDAPSSTSYETIFNAMIDDGATVISNSWSACENQFTLARVQSIDSVLQNAAVAGISVFNGSGDSGTTCLDGSANTIGVPSDSPNATAVGGTSPVPGPGLSYGSETWWNGVSNTPPTGQGGYGVSQFFSAPAYQSVLSGSAMRSVPDVVADADPAQGLVICEADKGGCPSGGRYGGTSMAAPEWAAYVAALNAMLGANIGNVNVGLYPLAGTNAFHSAASMSSDFAHVGLGSPDLPALRLALTGLIPGPASASLSFAVGGGANADASAPADGATAAVVQTFLTDANGFPLGGKTVSLSADGGHATISPPSAVTDKDGAAEFSIKDLSVEDIDFTATDTTDGVVVTQKASLSFVPPSAAAAGLNAFPSTVTADGVTPADITVTLQDSLGRPAPGKLVQINQTGGNSVISGPIPPVTDSNGQIEFTAVDSNNETITYSAVDVTDGNLPFPATGTVTFNDAPEPGCSNTEVAGPGFVATPYASGFLAQNFSYGNINFSGCPGAWGLAFDSGGNLYVSDLPSGNLYKFPPGGGVANGSTLLANLGPALASLVIDGSGNLYGTRFATTGNFFTGAVLQIDPSAGTIIGTVAQNLTCPGPLSLDPLSGDLFTDDSCNGGGANNSALWRISGLSGVSPTTSVYTNLPNTPNANIAFSSSGNMYIWDSGQGAMVTATDGPNPPVVTTIPKLGSSYLGMLAYGQQSNGDAKYLITNFPGNTSITPNSPLTTNTFDLTNSTPTIGTPIIANGGATGMVAGPGGCIYIAQGTTVWKITDTSGACNYAPQNPPPALSLSPATLVSNASQGHAVTLTASVLNTNVPDGTSVLLSVTGANPRTLQANTSSGTASFSYTGAHQGTDTIVASASVPTSVPTATTVSVTSNQAVVTWGPGTDVTFLTLNGSPSSALPGATVTLTANLTDISTNTIAPLVGQTVGFSLGGSNCSIATDSNGNASCQVTPGGSGTLTLTANFAGTGQYNPSSDSKSFSLMAPVPPPTPTATRTATPTVTATVTPTVTATPTPVAGKLKIQPKKLNFGTVNIGANKAKTVKVTNAGKTTKKKTALPILIEMETATPSAFTVSTECVNDDLNPKAKGQRPGTCTIGVTFTPTEAIKYSGNLTIIDNLEPSFHQVVPLTGVGKTPK